jgi:hypothetical protein
MCLIIVKIYSHRYETVCLNTKVITAISSLFLFFDKPVKFNNYRAFLITNKLMGFIIVKISSHRYETVCLNMKEITAIS